MRWIWIIIIFAFACPVYALDFSDAQKVLVRGETIVLDNAVHSDRIIIEALYPAPSILHKKVIHISFDSFSSKRFYSDGRVSGWKIKFPKFVRRIVDFYIMDIDGSDGMKFEKVY